jgi:hypothetical protein
MSVNADFPRDVLAVLTVNDTYRSGRDYIKARGIYTHRYISRKPEDEEVHLPPHDGVEKLGLCLQSSSRQRAQSAPV